jgi:hypothetical protein
MVMRWIWRGILSHPVMITIVEMAMVVVLVEMETLSFRPIDYPVILWT